MGWSQDNFLTNTFSGVQRFQNAVELYSWFAVLSQWVIKTVTDLFSIINQLVSWTSCKHGNGERIQDFAQAQPTKSIQCPYGAEGQDRSSAVWITSCRPSWWVMKLCPLLYHLIWFFVLPCHFHIFRWFNFNNMFVSLMLTSHGSVSPLIFPYFWCSMSIMGIVDGANVAIILSVWSEIH